MWYIFYGCVGPSRINWIVYNNNWTGNSIFIIWNSNNYLNQIKCKTGEEKKIYVNRNRNKSNPVNTKKENKTVGICQSPIPPRSTSDLFVVIEYFIDSFAF